MADVGATSQVKPSPQTILVTGGAGFIGSHLVERLVALGHRVINLDLLTYAGNLENLAAVEGHERYTFVRGNIGDRQLVKDLLVEHKPATIFNLAAESHVDRSIDDATDFIDTNVDAVQRLLDVTMKYWRTLPAGEKNAFRYIQMSTDETYGSIADGLFTEESPYAPNSPYAASKAAGDHFVRAYRVTYGLPTLIARASNTYGPRQFPEKLIPHLVICALEGRPLPVYGQGTNVRDWMYVGDLVDGLSRVVADGIAGETYNFAGCEERKNIDTVRSLCVHLDRRVPRSHPYETTIHFVQDRPGHDFRYAMSIERVGRLLGWKPQVSFDVGLPMMIDWYLANKTWWQAILDRGYRAARIGLQVS